MDSTNEPVAASPSTTSSTFDIHAEVQRAMDSLSEFGKSVVPRPASEHPDNRVCPHILTAISAKPNEVPVELASQVDLVQLHSLDARFDENMIPILQAITAKHGNGAMLLPQEMAANVPRCAQPPRSDPCYEPSVLWAWLTRDETRRTDPKADRLLPMPPYDVNKGFHASDIAAYPTALEGWPLYGPNGVARSRAAASPIVGEESKGGKTVSQMFLEGPAPGEPMGLFLEYKEELTRELGRAAAVEARIRAMQHADPPPPTRFEKQVLERTRVTAAATFLESK